MSLSLHIYIIIYIYTHIGFPGSSVVKKKNLPAIQEM